MPTSFLLPFLKIGVSVPGHQYENQEYLNECQGKKYPLSTAISIFSQIVKQVTFCNDYFQQKVRSKDKSLAKIAAINRPVLPPHPKGHPSIPPLPPVAHLHPHRPLLPPQKTHTLIMIFLHFSTYQL